LNYNSKQFFTNSAIFFYVHAYVLKHDAEIDTERNKNKNNNIAIWSGMTNAVLQVSGPL